ncbi:MAG TPA: peptidylprolyl isomerase [Flavobacteriaceae bacterium]|nr:peptidylprolyl isomerase [Flavobacteriaceae bacterium]
MKMKKNIALLFFVAPFLFFAQTQKQVIFTVDDEAFYVENFERMYLKNQDIIDEKAQTDIDSYLDLYIDYILKVKAAKAENLDESVAFQKEFEKYRGQLANKYLSETNVTEALVQEAYQRMQTAVNASHILIRVSPNAAPEDTLKAYQKALELRKKIIAGGNFETFAKKYSEDPSAKKNGGNLGWFTVFKMVYPFETAAYETETGKVSMPVKTQFGYHLVKVNDKRPAKGKVSVAHIMLVENKSDSATNAKKRIFELYDQLQQGASFESLAEKFSDDKNSAKKGGQLAPFAPGTMNAEKFEKVAFSMKKPGWISEPFQTKFGWHIIKLIEKHPIGSLEETRNKIEEQIKNDSRARLISESLLENLRKKYNIDKNEEALNFFHQQVSDDILKGTWQLDSAKIPTKNIVEINNESKTYLDFANYISQRQLPSNSKNKKALIDNWYRDFTDRFVLDYHKKHLGDNNPEFAAIASEYYNGLLIFDLMEEKIWNAAKKDSLGLKKYFKKNKREYATKNLEDVRGKVVSDYQTYLEDKWMKNLHKKYKVEINHENLEKLKARFE